MVIAKTFKDIDVAHVKLAGPSKLLKNRLGYIVVPTVNGQSLSFQTPVMPLSWNVEVRESEMGKSCSLPQKIDLGSPSAVEFQRWLEQITAMFKTEISAHGSEWINGVELETKKVARLSMMTPPKDNMALAFTPRLQYDKLTDVITTCIVDVHGTKMDPATLTRGTRVIAIVSVNYVYISKNGGTVSINVTADKVCVFPGADGASLDFDFDADEETRAAKDSFVATPPAPPSSPASAASEPSPVTKKAKTEQRISYTSDGSDV